MSIYQRMTEVFHQAGLPGFLNYWRKSSEYPEIPSQFCVYTVTQEGAALAADDCELIHETQVTLDMYGRSDLSAAHGRLKEVLMQNGFDLLGQSDAADVYSGEWRYHKRMKLTRFEEV